MFWRERGQLRITDRSVDFFELLFLTDEHATYQKQTNVRTHSHMSTE